MREALTSFLAEVDKLHRFLDASDAEEELTTSLLGRPEKDREDLGELLSSIQKTRTTKRRQNYVSCIVVLYGALERYVEEAVSEFTEALVQIPGHYSELPKALREQHLRLSIEYLASLKDGKVRETEDLASVVGALHGCLNGHYPFKLNARAFSLRSSNMKLGRIREIMGSLDIAYTGRRILSTCSYDKYLGETSGISASNMQDSEVQANLDHVDELVVLRNDIAHGVYSIESIEDNDLVRERAHKLCAFVAATNDILVCELLKYRISAEHAVQIEGEVKVYGDNIVCFPWLSGRIALGDTLIMKPAAPNADLRHGAIQSIQINNVDHEDVEGKDELMIGVRVPFKVKANGTFFVIMQKNESDKLPR